MFIRNGTMAGSIRTETVAAVIEREVKRQKAIDAKAAKAKAVSAPVVETPEVSTPEIVPPVEFVYRPEPSVSKPESSASKSEWVDFAVSKGLDREEAQALTKQALIDLCN